MPTFASVLMLAGAVLIGLGVRIARSPISDHIVREVIDAVQASSGNRPSEQAMRAHIRRDRRDWGLKVAGAGGVLIAIALGTL